MTKTEENKKKNYIIAIVVLAILLILSLTGTGVNWKFNNSLVEKLIKSNDSLLVVQDNIIAREENIILESNAEIEEIRRSKIVYINTDGKWKKKYDELQKDYDVILHKLYTQQYLDSLANNFLFRK